MDPITKSDVVKDGTIFLLGMVQDDAPLFYLHGPLNYFGYVHGLPSPAFEVT